MWYCVQPIFHEGSKGYSCCKRRTLDFDEFRESSCSFPRRAASEIVLAVQWRSRAAGRAGTSSSDRRRRTRRSSSSAERITTKLPTRL